MKTYDEFLKHYGLSDNHQAKRGYEEYKIQMEIFTSAVSGPIVLKGFDMDLNEIETGVEITWSDDPGKPALRMTEKKKH